MLSIIYGLLGPTPILVTKLFCYVMNIGLNIIVTFIALLILNLSYYGKFE